MWEPRVGIWVKFTVPKTYFGAAKLTVGEVVTGWVTSFGAGTVQVHIPERGSAIVSDKIVRSAD